MSIQQTQALTETIQELGYDSVNVFALEKAKEALRHEIALYQKEIDKYELKYTSDYKNFVEKFDQLNRFGLFEKEDDKIEWRAYVSAIESTQNKLKALTD